MSYLESRFALMLRVFKSLFLPLSLVSVMFLVPGEESSSASSRNSQLEQYTSASRIYVDPNTGLLSGAPIDSVGALTQLPLALRNSLSTSSAGLVIEDGVGGGKMVRLQGRFRHLSVATASGDSIECFDGAQVGISAERSVK